MKIDRFVKVMLVIIALLLAINCANGIRAPFTGNSTQAAVPPRFLQQGKTYSMEAAGRNFGLGFKVVAIEDSGWIKVTQWDKGKNQPDDGGTYWVNTANLSIIEE